jgi:imidazole glycerol-phosphate synthase subunit HisH
MIAIIQYNAGNTRSVQNALNRLQCESIITDDATLIRSADKVIFPGVGEASTAMRYLRERGLDSVITSLTQPFLGICLGMQLMCNHSEENDTDCLGIFDTEVKLFPATGIVPHIGWNNLASLKGPLVQHLGENDDMYFVHSYYAAVCHETIAQCDYLLPFSAAMQKNNFYGVQFHPEKSAQAGEQLLKNFLTV